jgi:hypothetical protein
VTGIIMFLFLEVIKLPRNIKKACDYINSITNFFFYVDAGGC